MKKINRILSLILVCCLMAGMLCINVSAADVFFQ